MSIFSQTAKNDQQCPIQQDQGSFVRISSRDFAR